MDRPPDVVAVDAAPVLVFLLVLARTSAWVLVAPALRSDAGARVGRIALAVPLSFFLVPLAPVGALPGGTLQVIALLGVQVVVGLAFGWLTALLFTAFEIAGGWVDFLSGFSLGALFDPVTGAQSAAFARLHGLLALALLLATPAFDAVLAGFAASFRALPLDAALVLSGGSADALGRAAATLFLAALMVGAPLLGVLVLTDATLAVSTRFVPQANALVVGLPLKALVALGFAGLTLTAAPGLLAGLVDPALRLPAEVFDLPGGGDRVPVGPLLGLAP